MRFEDTDRVIDILRHYAEVCQGIELLRRGDRTLTIHGPGIPATLVTVTNMHDIIAKTVMGNLFFRARSLKADLRNLGVDVVLPDENEAFGGHVTMGVMKRS